MLHKTWQNFVTTPIPSGVDPSHVVNILHDHGFLITMSPIVTRYEQSSTTHVDANADPSGTNGGKKINYDVWENIDVLPGGLMKKEITFKCAFKNKDEGVVSWIQAPMGLMSRATYSVKFEDGVSGADGQEAGGWMLHEEIESSCSVFLKTFVEKTMVNTRKEMHGRIVDKARERSP